jgi:hypothetical protein
VDGDRRGLPAHLYREGHQFTSSQFRLDCLHEARGEDKDLPGLRGEGRNPSVLVAFRLAQKKLQINLRRTFSEGSSSSVSIAKLRIPRPIIKTAGEINGYCARVASSPY